jgi:GntR family transcriptional repressor for pyruvate dehydrogenase complex
MATQAAPDQRPRETGGSTLVQRAVDAVNAHIVENQLKVGDTLPGEGHFAAKLGVSRAVMREAFGALAALRQIDVGNGRRPRVGAIDGSVMAASLDHAIATAQVSMAEIWEVRRTLELRTAELAALHRSDAQAEQMRTLVDAMGEAGEAGDMAALIRHDIEFHQCVSAASGNALFHQIIRSFEAMMSLAVPTAWQTRTSVEQRAAILGHHRALATAICERDPDAAAMAMNVHFDTSIGDMLRQGERGGS